MSRSFRHVQVGKAYRLLGYKSYVDYHNAYFSYIVATYLDDCFDDDCIGDTVIPIGDWVDDDESVYII